MCLHIVFHMYMCMCTYMLWVCLKDLSFFLKFCGPKKGLVLGKSILGRINLSTLSADTAGELDVLGHDGDTLGVDGAQVGVLEQTNQVGLAGLLQSHHSRALEPQVGLEVLSNLTNKALEWQLADEQFSRLLVPEQDQIKHQFYTFTYLLISRRATVPGL